MGRAKIEIKKIEDPRDRKVRFQTRSEGLLKKARELAVLCNAQVAVIHFSESGKMFEFFSSNMYEIISKFIESLKSTQSPAVQCNSEETKEADILKEEIEKLKLKQQQMLGEDLTGMDTELLAAEKQLTKELLCVKERKEQLLVQRLEHARMTERRAMLEIKALRQQIAELQPFIPSNSQPATLSADKRHDTTLYLRPPRMTP